MYVLEQKSLRIESGRSEGIASERNPSVPARLTESVIVFDGRLVDEAEVVDVLDVLAVAFAVVDVAASSPSDVDLQSLPRAFRASSASPLWP